jgi:hypothetical protein
MYSRHRCSFTKNICDQDIYWILFVFDTAFALEELTISSLALRGASTLIRRSTRLVSNSNRICSPEHLLE